MQKYARKKCDVQFISRFFLLFKWLICVILIILDCELDDEAYEDGSEIPTIDCNTW